MSARHYVIVTGSEEDPDFGIECAAPDECHGWIECGGQHQVDGVAADLGPYDDCPERAPWEDHYGFEFHGKYHEWRSGCGWVVEFVGCIINEAVFGWGGADFNDFLGLPPGRYEAETDWYDDECCALTLIGERPAASAAHSYSTPARHPLPGQLTIDGEVIS